MKDPLVVIGYNFGNLCKLIYSLNRARIRFGCKPLVHQKKYGYLEISCNLSINIPISLEVVSPDADNLIKEEASS
jgi:hypothetical protein